MEPKVDLINDQTIIGAILKGRFEIKKFLDKGSNGEVYKVIDHKNPDA